MELARSPVLGINAITAYDGREAAFTRTLVQSRHGLCW
jgi:hypothetical protein